MKIFTNKKRKIILAAISEFAKKGFEKASIDAIALKAKVAKGTVFYHFKSKKDLFEEIVAEGQKTFKNIIERRIKELKTEKEKIELIIEIEVDFIRKYRDLFTIYLSTIFKKIVTFETIEQVLKNGISKGEFRNNLNVKTTAIALFWLTAMTTLNSKEVNIKEIKDLLLRGILK